MPETGFSCGEVCNDGEVCDLQPDHGGLMHSGVRRAPGVNTRVWWDRKTGERVVFA